MWFLCFLLGVCVMNIPESHAKLTHNSWMSDEKLSGSTNVCPEDFIEDIGDVKGGGIKGVFSVNSIEECVHACQNESILCNSFMFSPTQNKCVIYIESQPNNPKYQDFDFCKKKQVIDIWSSMAEAIKERLENIPPKRDNTSELSKALLKLDDLMRYYDSAQDIMNISQYNILEDLFLKIVENPSLDDHFPDFASSFQNAILPTAIQSKNEDSPLLKSKLETPFPDPVDDSADPHEEMVTIDGNFEDCVLKDKPGERCFGRKWVSTGLYAKQGQLVKVTVPSNVVGKFDIQLGAHTDRPFEYNQEKWLEGNNHIRPCCITQIYANDLIKEETKLLSAYGGLIYISIPGSSQLGNFTLKFDKVITSPTFIEGKTTNEEWYKMLASTKSPMTELEVPGVIVTIPRFQFENAHYNTERLSSRLAQLMQAFFDMQGYVMPRPHRYAYDFIPAVAHSGYPAMDGEVANYTRELLQLANETEPNKMPNVWAMLHEIGHNIQNGIWTPGKLGETTNNIFAQYANEVVLNVNQRQLPNFEHVEEYKRNGRNFSSVPHFGLLNIFMFVKEECSWNTYKKFFKYYNEEKIPQSMVENDDKKYSLIARVLSEKCNKNLFPFFKWWNWPILSDDEEATKNLPEWKGIIDRLEKSRKKPDYLKEKDTDFTGTDIWRKKTDGE